MENHFPSEVTHVVHHEKNNEVRNVTIILSVFTIIELIIGFMMIKMTDGSTAKIASKIAIIFFMLAKAYYIVGYFMHLKHEIRNFIMTIIVPLCLFIWFIAAFLWDGDSWKNLRNTNARSQPAQTEQHHQPAVDKDAKK